MPFRLTVTTAALCALVFASACVDIVSADLAKYVEREEKHFTTPGKPDVSVATFDGSIEVRPWDRAEVQVIVEKRAIDKKSVQTIDVQTRQDGNHIVVEVKVPQRKGFGIHFARRTAKLIVSVPAVADLSARSGDGSIDVEGITGRVELRSGDGGIHASRLDGDIKAHTGDKGVLNVDTGDGSIVADGTFTSVRARSGDGSVRITAESGSVADGDWDIATGDGSVTLALPDTFGAQIDAHTGDGSIHMQDVTLSNVTGQIAKNTVRGTLGAGGSTVRVRTGDGSITLKRS